ncbi:acyl-CoA thioesterase [Psychromonas aquatilis]|uniref:Acyl-CoA thioesterase n=1 Tax=Psychromonas aquatilis TaxID=2005072 RepID=A0ABU9GQH9_9GAMM
MKAIKRIDRKQVRPTDAYIEDNMEPKKVSFSNITVVQQMMDVDANIAGNVHGGSIMKLVDNTACMVGMRHTGGNAVTASLDRLDFHSPVYVGDILRIKTSVNYVGSTSMEIGARIEAEAVLTGEVRHTASAYLTFVSLDEHGKPRQIPQIICETADERKRFAAAKERKIKRAEERKREREMKQADIA